MILNNDKRHSSFVKGNTVLADNILDNDIMNNIKHKHNINK